ncbi:hypothetical protein [Alkalicoccus urumqiensis]|uniref:Uncharacterized protein n=1 Tax=Alkalicoccus urumqiensis TaxID=1548213 RepID=A0A2P6MKS3_ALKUR|nr:hypothetical protein [Alkalicoccus urumqiensis]PRO66887.1 hypothetical protein C6I21_02910 [Alkalicoccus urumqiensis]
MNSRPLQLELGIRIFSAALLLFILFYFGYYTYIGMHWGLREGSAGLLVSDGILLLLLPAAVLLFFFKAPGWWLLMIGFVYLLLSKVVLVLANIVLSVAGLFTGQESQGIGAADVFYILFYAAVLLIFSLPAVRQASGVFIENKRVSAFWKIFPFALALYLVYFYVMFQVSFAW